MRGRVRRAVAVMAGVAMVSAVAVACGSDDDGSASTAVSTAPGATSSEPPSDVTLTVYTDQHAELVEGLTQAYTDATGVTFNIQNDATVGQILAEGGASPADVFLSEDPTPVAELGAAGLLAPVRPSTLEQARPGLSSGSGWWVAYAARTRVLYYNPTVIDEADLPATLADIVDPKYAGQFAWAPSGAFVATTQYLLSTQGEERTRTFLEGIKANGVNEQKNGNVRDTVEAGTHAMGLSNHYYWWVLANQRGGPEQLTSKIYHFPSEDPGNLILSSGAGILASSEHVDAAQDFLAWLTSADGGQKVIATADPEVSEAQYPIAPGVASSIAGDLSEVQSPSFDMDVLAEVSQAEELLKEMGLSQG